MGPRFRGMTKENGAGRRLSFDASARYRPRMLRFLLPLALLALAGCGTKQAPVEDADPALWVVRDEDTTIYLFGTVHVLKPGWAGSTKACGRRSTAATSWCSSW